MSDQKTKEMIITPLNEIEKKLQAIQLRLALCHLTFNDVKDISQAISGIKYQLYDIINIIFMEY